ncbi:MAG: hypothetical protein Kow0069_00710 [Promethearchaeota archaeon]
MNVIVGAGPAGLSAGYELVKNGLSCLVVEKNDRVGGISTTYQFGEFRTDNGPHRFFSKNPMLYDLIEELLGDDWVPVPRLTRQYINGKYYHYPVKVLQAFFNAGPSVAVRMALDFALSFVRKTLLNPPTLTFEDWVVLNFGRRLAEFNLINYTEKIWGISTREISANWAEQRIQGLSIFEMIKKDVLKMDQGIATMVEVFYYPRYGIGQVYETMARRIEEAGSEVRLETRPAKIVTDGTSKVTEVVLKRRDGQLQTVPVTNLVSSMPITELVEILDPPAPPEVLEAARSLSYRDQRYVFLMIDRERCTEDTWIYFPTPDIPFGRMMEPKNWTQEMSPPGKTSLFIEYFCFEGDKIWTMSEEQLVRMTVKYLVALGFFEEGEVIDAKVLNLKKAYPIWNIGYEKILKVIKDYLAKFENLYLVGRNGRFHYNNQDHSIETGILAARSIIEDKKYDLEVVGTENEYFEKGALLAARRARSASRFTRPRVEKKKKNWFRRHPRAARGLSFLLGVGLILGMLFYTGVHEKVNYLLRIEPIWVVGACSVFLFGYFLRAVRWRLVLNPYISPEFDPHLLDLTVMECFGAFTNLVLPLKMGDVTKGLVLGRRHQLKFTNSFATVVLERVFDIIVLGLLIILPLLYFGAEVLFKEDFRFSITVGIGLVGVIIAGTLILIFKKNFVVNLLERVLTILPIVKKREGFKMELKALLEQLDVVLRKVLESPLRSLSALLLSATIWVLEGLVAFLIATAMEIRVNFLLIVSAVIIANFLKSFPVTPGGIGFYELGLSIVLVVGGIPAADAAVVAILEHLVKNLILLVSGGITTLAFGSSRKLLAQDRDLDT